MAKQRDIAALREAVQSTEFTPAAREIGALVDLLDDAVESEAVVQGAERAILRASGSGAVAARVVAKLTSVGTPARVRALRILGSLAPTDVPAAEAILDALAHGDARTQRAAAHALGRLGASEAKAEIEAAVLAAWDETPELPLARGLAEAMGKLGIAGAHARLSQVLEGDAELARIAQKALALVERDGTRGEASAIAGQRAATFDSNVVLYCRPGLEALMIDELSERSTSVRAVTPRAGRPGEVTAVWRGAPAELMSVRTMLRFAFALPDEPCTGEADALAACVRALTSKTARRILTTWTQGAVRYRLGWQGRGHRRGATWRLVEALRGEEPTWTNDPTDSTWHVSLAVAGSAVRVLLEPRKLDDPRFVYRVRDVPAASHPTIAAALVRASVPRPGDVVWDPFTGSGCELIERAFAGRYARLIGSDLDPHALEAARANVAVAQHEEPRLDILFEEADATFHAPSGVTCIITNPPMGRRVARDGSLATLLDAFTDHAAKVLARGGRLVWLSPLGARTAARAELNQLRVSLRQPVDMGGFQAELQVWHKD